jgi:hypothetical protein
VDHTVAYLEYNKLLEEDAPIYVNALSDDNQDTNNIDNKGGSSTAMNIRERGAL